MRNIRWLNLDIAIGIGKCFVVKTQIFTQVIKKDKWEK